jgi:hypothetical protein
MHRIRYILCALLFYIPSGFSVQEAGAKDSATVFYVASESSGTTTSLFTNIKNSFDDKRITLKFVNSENGALEKRQDALYIAVGTRSLEYLLNEKFDAHILAIFISRVSFQQILSAYGGNTPGLKISAIYSDPSPLQQFFLAKHLFPHGPKASVIISSKTAFLKAELEKAAELASIPLHVSVQTEQKNLNKTLHDLQNSGILIALPDSSVYNKDSIQQIILSAYRRNQSIIGFSRQLVSAGSLATVYSDADDIRQDLIDHISHYIEYKALKPSAYPRSFNIDINERVAKSYNLVLPDKSVLKQRIEQSLEACCEK